MSGSECRWTASQLMKVTVVEVNSPPTLAAIADQTVNEGVALTVNTVASDPDIPVQTLTYSLTAAPTGMNISTAGVITFTPSETQGGSVFNVTVTVSDGSLTASQVMKVTAVEVNSPPTLAGVVDRKGNEGGGLTVNTKATDPDIPAQTLTYSLTAAPTGMS